MADEQPAAAKESGATKKAPAAPTATADSRAKSSTGERRALIVAINDYPGTINDLPSCVNDGKAMADLLKSQYAFSTVATLFDAQATVADVKTGLDTLVKAASDKDRLVFFYSGHGSTQKRGQFLDECLMLYDGPLFDDDLSAFSQRLPPGIFEVILDSCFSGGMEKRLLKLVFNGTTVTDRAKIKAYTRADPKEFEEHIAAQNQARFVRRFGGSVVDKSSLPSLDILEAIPALKAIIPPPMSDEIGQTQLNGILLSACLETETAAASTSQTEGKSAFTYCLLKSLARVGPSASINDVVEATQQMCHHLGLIQTPLVKEPNSPKDLGKKAFITLEEAKPAPKVQDDALTSLLELLKQRQESGGTDMNQLLLPLLLSVLGKGGQSKGGLGDLLPVILPLILKGGGKQQEKLFGIDDAILIPAIISIVTAVASKQPQAESKGGLGDLLPVILPMILKGGAGQQEKIFGIDDAILIPAIAAIVTAVASKQPQAESKGGLGDLLPVILPMILKGGAGQQEKIFGIDDAIIIPAIVAIATAAIKR